MKTKSRNIGGSLLPSNNEHILQPIQTPFGVLQVRVLESEDTHVLTLTRGGVETTICKHPNGFSCHELAERMLRIEKQAEFIRACGGECLETGKILKLMIP